MAQVTVEFVKKFLTEEILHGPLAESVPAEPLSLFLDQYLSDSFQEGVLPLEALFVWLEREQGASAGTVQLVFERLKAKARKRGIVLLLPGEQAPAAPAEGDQTPAAEPLESPAAPAVPTFRAEDIILVNDRAAFVGMDLNGREKSLLIFLDGVRTLDQASARTKMPVEEIGEFLQKYWSMGKFQLVNPPTPPPGAEAAAAPSPVETVYSDDLPPKYERKAPPPSAKKSTPAKPVLVRTAAVPSAPVSGAQKAVVVAVLVGLLLSASYAVYYVIKARNSDIHLKTLNVAEYSAILPLTNAQQTGKVFIGTMDLGRWNQMSRDQKREGCAKLYQTLKVKSVAQIQIRASTGEMLALVYDENRISFVR